MASIDELVDALLSDEAERARGLGLHGVGVGRWCRLPLLLLVPVVAPDVAAAAWLLARALRPVVEPDAAVLTATELCASESSRCCTALMSRPMRRLRRSISSCAA